MQDIKLPEALGTAVIISDFFGLAFELTLQLLLLKFKVIIVCENLVPWKENFSSDKGIKFYKPSEKEKIIQGKTDYIVCINIPSNDNTEEVFKKIEVKMVLTKELSLKTFSKTLFVFPFLQDEKLKNIVNLFSDLLLADERLFCGVVFISDVLCALPEDKNFWYLDKILKEAKTFKKLTFLPTSFVFNPLSLKTATNFLIKSLFSLKAYGKRSALTGKPLSTRAIVSILKRVEKEFYFNYEKKVSLPQKSEFSFRLESGEDVKELLLSSYISITASEASDRQKEELATQVNDGGAKKKIFFKSRYLLSLKGVELKKIFWKFLVMAFYLLVPPIMLMFSSLFLLALNKNAYSKNMLKVSGVLVKSANISSRVSRVYSQALSRLPILEPFYQELFETSNLLERESQIAFQINKLTATYLKVWESLSGQSEDTLGMVKDLELGLDVLYNDLGFLRGEFHQDQMLFQKIVKVAIADKDTLFSREKLFLLSELLDSFLDLLGKDSPKTYLVLIQDSTVIRPTGGMINSFALVTFSEGRILKTQISPVSFADRNLNGQVEPPSALKKYFNQKKWFLRDSNWDPDFTLSAAQAEWFIDKELDVSVNGVIAIDTEFIKDILGKIGGIELNGEKITNQNFYQLTRTKVEDNYPEKEATATSSQVLGEVLKTVINLKDKKKQQEVAKLVIEGLEKRRIQVFLHQREAQHSLSDLSWDGSVKTLECSEPCNKDLVALVEADINGTDDPLVRNVQLGVSLEEGLIKRRLTLFIENAKDQVYKMYLRAVSTSDSGFSPVEVLGKDNSFSLNPEVRGTRGFKEAGVYLEVPPHETEVVSFSWESAFDENFENKAEYALLIRKQASIEAYPFGLRLKVPTKYNFSSELPFGLTKEGELIYNTIQSQDIHLRLYLSKNE